MLKRSFFRHAPSSFFAPSASTASLVARWLLLTFVLGTWLPLHAEMLVLNAGMSGDRRGTGEPIVLRFDPATGAKLGWFGYNAEDYHNMSVTSGGEVFVTSDILGDDDLQHFTPDGKYMGTVATATWGRFAGTLRGPDGNLYSIMQQTDHYVAGPWVIVRHDHATPTVFIPAGSGGMSQPVTMLLGADGNLYVADTAVGILRFNATTGAFGGILVPNGRGGLPAPTRMTFGPDGRLYVTNDAANAVYRFDGSTGAFVDIFVPAGAGGLATPCGVAFGPDGNLYVVSRGTKQVLRFNGSTGAFLNVAASDPELLAPTDLAFSAPRADTVWFDDELPAGAAPSPSWPWVESNPTPYSGIRAHGGVNGGGLEEHSFNFANPLQVTANDSFFVYVYAEYSPAEVMLSWCDGQGWEHRAYWGADFVDYGQSGSASRRYMGQLPTDSGWIRLEIPATAVGLGGANVQGMSFTAYGGRVTWDQIGKASRSSSVPPPANQSSPGVAISEPAAGATVSGMLNAVAGSQGNLRANRVTFYIDATDFLELVDDPPSPWTFRWDTHGRPNGNHTVRVVARDAAGVQYTDSRTINIQNTDDVVRPTIALTAPTDNSTVSGDVVIQAQASDNVAVAKVEFEVNGALIGTDNTAPYGVTWNSRTLPDNTYTLVARAIDTSGNINAVLATITVANATPPPPPPTGGNEVVWVEDAIPAGGWGGGNGGDGWNWVSANPAPYSGTLAHQSSNSTGLHDHGFNGATPLAIQSGDQLMVYVYLNPAVPPQAVMLSWNDGSSWDHRAFWGADVIPYGTPNTPGHVRAGDLPAAGGWARLTVSAAAVGLEGRQVSGLSFILSNGSVTWDRAGKLGAGSPPPPPPPPASGDTTAPAVSLLNPANAATVSGVVSLRAQASDNQALGSLQIKVDGTVVASTSASGATADYSSSWNSATVANGSHTLNAIAVDAAGNQTTSASVAVTVSNGTPAVSVWMEDAIPVGGSPGAVGGDAWTWISNPSPASPSGAKVHQSANVSGYHEHSFNFAWYPLAVGTGDEIFVYVLIDPANPPKELILSWCDGSSWEHRAYWGENRVDFGTNNTPSRHYYGPLPATGSWVQLRIPASDVGLEGRSISGMAFGLFDGRASWDTVGKVGQ